MRYNLILREELMFVLSSCCAGWFFRQDPLHLPTLPNLARAFFPDLVKSAVRSEMTAPAPNREGSPFENWVWGCRSRASDLRQEGHCNQSQACDCHYPPEDRFHLG